MWKKSEMMTKLVNKFIDSNISFFVVSTKKGVLSVVCIGYIEPLHSVK